MIDDAEDDLVGLGRVAAPVGDCDTLMGGGTGLALTKDGDGACVGVGIGVEFDEERVLS